MHAADVVAVLSAAATTWLQTMGAGLIALSLSAAGFCLLTNWTKGELSMPTRDIIGTVVGHRLARVGD